MQVSSTPLHLSAGSQVPLAALQVLVLSVTYRSVQLPAPSHLSRASHGFVASSVALVQVTAVEANLTGHVLSVPLQVSAGSQVPLAALQTVLVLVTILSAQLPAPSHLSRASH